MGEGTERVNGEGAHRPGKIASLLAGDFSLHEVTADRSLRLVRAPSSEADAPLAELVSAMGRYARRD